MFLKARPIQGANNQDILASPASILTIYVTHIRIELAAQHKLKSMCVSNRCLQISSIVASHWRQTGLNIWSLLPTFLFVQTVIPTWWECRVRPLLLLPLFLLPCVLLSNPSHIFLWYVRLCLMAPGPAKGSHWLTGGFDSLAFAEAVNHPLSIATSGHSFGHPFVCCSSVV